MAATVVVVVRVAGAAVDCRLWAIHQSKPIHRSIDWRWVEQDLLFVGHKFYCSTAVAAIKSQWVGVGGASFVICHLAEGDEGKAVVQGILARIAR